MFKIKSATRLALTIGFICASLLWLATGLQIVPNPFSPVIEGRVNVTKSVAVSVTAFAENQRFVEMQQVLDRVVAHNDQLISIGVRRFGKYVIEAGPHSKIWKSLDGKSTENQICVSINTNNQHWGDLELYFQPIPMRGFSSMFVFPLPMVAFLACSMSLATWYVLSKTFRYLNPSQVVPGRVKSAFDTLAEGLMLIDKSGEIAHANESFCQIVGLTMEQIVGLHVDDLDWGIDESILNEDYPWKRCLEEGEAICGQIIEVVIGGGAAQKFIVNATPIMGEGQSNRGVLASFDDVTALEKKKTELSNIVQTLRRSRDEIERQNEKLNYLANFDPMTKCMNRRAFWVQYEQMWKTVEPSQLSIMMIDVDHFKNVNDTYGHSVGDEVLKETGQLLHNIVGESGEVCRYGGEEFTILLPNMEFEQAVVIAESVNEEFRSRKLANLDITVSIGVSNRSMKAMDPQHMLDQADQCLYAAKRNGRDQVVRFDQCPDDIEMPDEVEADVREDAIQYSAVTGLLSALSFRSQETAEHSLRVADLSVAIGSELLPRRQLYSLEVSALLHDIGKIGVPDAILNKPGPLSRKEWEIMAKHDDIGVEIVRAAFASDEIANIISGHHYCFSLRNSTSTQSLFQDEIPLCARIITVCDAFDAMVSDRVYRKGMPIEDAFAELRRCSPDQFDPKLVENLIDYVSVNGYSTEPGASLGNNSRSAVAIGKHIESICDAIESEDVDLLKSVVEDLKLDAVENQIAPIADTALRLNDAIGAKDSDLLQVLELADEVMGMCRSTRGAFVESAERTVTTEKQVKNKNS